MRTATLKDVAPAQPAQLSFLPSDPVWLLNLDQVEAQSGRVLEKVTAPASKAGSSTHVFDTGNVLYSKLRPYLNKVVCPDSSGIATTELVPLRPDPSRLDRQYLTHYLRSYEFVRWVSNEVAGAKMPRVSMKVFWRHAIPLPPLAEQKRIAAILDAADALRAKRRESLAQLDTLLKSTFLDMFGDPVTNPMGWEVVELRDHTTKVGSGATPRGGSDSYKAVGIALIRSMNVRDGEFQWKDLARIDDVQAGKLSNVVVEEDDVLLNITGASVARVCRAPRSVIPARVNQHVCIIRTAATVAPRFLEKLLLATSMKRRLLGIGESGSTRQAITKAQVLALAIPCPPLDLQCRFAEIVDSVEKQKAAQYDHLAELDTLFASLQQRAFRGGL